MHIRWTEPATRDLTLIGNYIEEHNDRAIAGRIVRSIFERISKLKDAPRQGRTGRKANTRELILSDLPYLVVYRIQQDAVEILRILHGAQNWP